MVFHYINFVQETNNWWLRRVRPVLQSGLTFRFGWDQHSSSSTGLSTDITSLERFSPTGLRASLRSYRKNLPSTINDHMGMGSSINPSWRLAPRKGCMKNLEVTTLTNSRRLCSCLFMGKEVPGR